MGRAYETPPSAPGSPASRWHEVGRGNVLGGTVGVTQAGDGDDVVLLRQQPRQRQLCEGGALALGELGRLAHDGDVGVEVLRLPPGEVLAEAVGGAVVRGTSPPR
jgi:hypothetical protein